MPSILSAVNSGIISPADDLEVKPEPVLDLNGAEEQELSFLSLATVGGGATGDREDKVSVLMMDSRVQLGGKVNKLESMMAVGVDGCKQVRLLMEGVIRQHGAKILKGMR